MFYDLILKICYLREYSRHLNSLNLITENLIDRDFDKKVKWNKYQPLVSTSVKTDNDLFFPNKNIG